MMRLLITTAGAALLAGSVAIAQSAGDQSVVRLDPALDALVSPDAKVELVKSGFGFAEGPVWVQNGKSGYLLFTDIPGNVIWKLNPQDGNASVFLYNAGFRGPDVRRWGAVQNNGYERNDPRFEEFAMIGADGLTIDREGRVIVASFADRYQGKRFNGPNDVVAKRDGAIYFTDTYGGLKQREKDPRKELESNGVFMWKAGKLAMVVNDMPAVNGLAFSPDEKYLYVNVSRDNYVRRYEVKPDGTLANGNLFIDLSKETEPGITDGLRVDT